MSEQSSNNIEEMIQKQQVMLEQILVQNKKIQRRITLMVIAGYIKFLLVIVPLIVAVFFLPPLLKQVTQQYTSLLGISSGSTASTFDASFIKQAIGSMSAKDVQEVFDMIGR